MNAPGKGMLKVVSILFIVFGAIGTVVLAFVSLIPLLASSALSQMGSAADQINAALQSAGAEVSGLSEAVGDASNQLAGVMSVVAPLLIIALVIGIVASLLELIIGIIGVGKAGDPSKAGFFITTGIILCAIQLISIILTLVAPGGSFQITGLIGFVLPILYIVGGNQNKNATQAPAA